MPDVLSALTTSIGVYSNSPTSYLSTLARVPGFRRSDLNGAVEERTLVRRGAMRGSVHLLPRAIVPEAVPANLDKRERSLGPVVRSAVGDDYESIAAAIEPALAGRQLTSPEIRAAVGVTTDIGVGLTYVLGMMRLQCRIVATSAAGGWRSNKLRYALWSDWLPDLDPFALAPEEARRRLVARYAAAYGPVTLDDVAWWAGWTKTQTKAAVEEVDLSGAGAAMAQLEGVRLLPVWDMLMVGYRVRDRLFDAEMARYIYDADGNATSVVLVEGRVVGVWELGKSDDPLALLVAPFGEWPKAVWRGVEEQADRIRELLAASSVTIATVDPVDLVAAPRNKFLSPLS